MMMNKYESILIQEQDISLLEKLCNAHGAPGDEGEIRKIIKAELGDSVDEIRTDAFGNLIVVKHAMSDPKLHVMVAAHMDEVAFMVVKDAEDDYCEFRVLGGVDPRALPAKKVLIGKSKVQGLISARTAHLVSASERSQMIKVDSLRFTIAKSNSGKIKAGDYAWFDTEFKKVGDTIRAKALDDRVGVANLIWLLKHAPPDIELTGVFTVQEELGLRGATVAAYGIDPDLGFAFDTTPSLDPPMYEKTLENTQYNARFGCGPVVYTVDRSQIHDPRLINFITNLADRNGIQYQKRQPGAGGTDSGAIHLARDGVLSQSISVPVRYLHSPRGMMKVEDWQQTRRLIAAIFDELSPEILKEEKR